MLFKRYGLDGEKPKTLGEIGEELNLSRERVRQILEQSLVKMKSTFVRKNFCI